MTVFVNIASFCDPHLEFTLDGVFKKACEPNEIFVGLIDQTYEHNLEWLSKKPYWPNIRYVQIKPTESRGVCWARSIGFSLFQNEAYFLQVDSHTHFDVSWDRSLIDSLGSLRCRTEKPIISTYPPPFQFNEKNEPFLTLTPTGTVYALRKHPETDLAENCATLRFRVEHIRGPEYVEGYHIAAGFIFTLGNFINEVPYDPYLYFHGEEQSLALRAYTHGWKIYHPIHDSIPLFHLYKEINKDYQTHHWHELYEKNRKTKWTELKKISDERLIQLVSGKITGCYGLGNIRTLEDFEKISGINYSQIYNK